MNGIQSSITNGNALTSDLAQRTNKENVQAKLAALDSTERDKSIEQQVTKATQTSTVNEVDAKEALSVPQLEKVAKQLQEFMGEMNRGLEFIVDEDSGRDVIKVIDKSSGDLVKQYPSEEVLSLVAKLSEATGNFIDSKIQYNQEQNSIT